MIQLEPIALAAASVAAVVVSSAWYAVMGARLVALRDRPAADPAEAAAPPPWKIGVELLRSLTVTTAVAAAVSGLGVTTVGAGLAFALAAWVAFPTTLLVGSVIWEDVPIGMAAIHGGDWLLKLAAITTIVTVWP